MIGVLVMTGRSLRVPVQQQSVCLDIAVDMLPRTIRLWFYISRTSSGNEIKILPFPPPQCSSGQLARHLLLAQVPEQS